MTVVAYRGRRGFALTGARRGVNVPAQIAAVTGASWGWRAACWRPTASPARRGRAVWRRVLPRSARRS